MLRWNKHIISWNTERCDFGNRRHIFKHDRVGGGAGLMRESNHQSSSAALGSWPPSRSPACGLLTGPAASAPSSTAPISSSYKTKAASTRRLAYAAVASRVPGHLQSHSTQLCLLLKRGKLPCMNAKWFTSAGSAATLTLATQHGLQGLHQAGSRPPASSITPP